MALLKEIGHFVTTNTFSGLYYSSIYPWTVGQLNGQGYGYSRNETEEECLHGTNADCTVPFILSDRSCFFIKKLCHAANTGALIMEVRMNLTVCFFSDLYKLGKNK